jgi:nucleoside-diphosphate-sugar epimerase
VLLAANYLLFRDELVPRNVAIFLSAVLTAAVTAVLLFPSEPRKQIASASVAPRAHRDESGPVLLVGGAGYIGSIVARRLLDRGVKVRMLDRLVYGYESIEGILQHPNFELIVGDCRNIQTVVGAVQGASAIVHLAAIVGDPACDVDRQTALETNYSATRMLIEVAKGHRIRRFLFASSCSVYGATEVMADERSPVQPISLYAQTKVDSEQALLAARSDFFQPTILRFATIFGYSYRPRFDLVVNLLTARAFQEGVITIFNGSQWRPFLHVEDAAESILRLLKAPLGLVGGQVFNVGSPKMNFTLTQVADKIREEFPQLRVEHVENSDRRDYRVSFQKIRSQIGFESKRSLEDGIQELKQVLQTGEVADYRDISYDNCEFMKAIGASNHADEIDARVMAAFAAPTAGPRARLLAVQDSERLLDLVAARAS